MIDWRHFVSAGSVVEPKPVWNDSEPIARHLASSVEVIKVIENKHCRAERSFVVKGLAGVEVEVPAIWFEKIIHPT